MAAAGAVVALCAAWALLVAGIEPVPTWFYVFAWYPTLVLFDQAARRRDGRPSLFHHPAGFLTMAAWSVLLWLVFEAANFRLQNWYYVFLPDRAWERWLGIVVSFATVVPAVVTVERWLRSLGVGTAWRTRPLPRAHGTLWWATALGAGMAAAALAFPRMFFPLIWGAAWLLADPILYRRAPEWSLLWDAERGDWRRIGRILLGGAVIGLIWEAYNALARGKWIYTVPWLEHTKLFEMPPLGFLGFPFFALEAWSMYHVVASVGLAPAADGTWRQRPSRTRCLVAAIATIAVAALILTGVEHRTISSTTPRLANVPGFTTEAARAVHASGYSSVFALARAAERRTADLPAAPSAIESARLSALRGIGTTHAAALRRAGVTSVCALAASAPDPLWTALTALATDRSRRHRPTGAEVRVWIGAARRHCPDWAQARAVR